MQLHGQIHIPYLRREATSSRGGNATGEKPRMITPPGISNILGFFIETMTCSWDHSWRQSFAALESPVDFKFTKSSSQYKIPERSFHIGKCMLNGALEMAIMKTMLNLKLLCKTWTTAAHIVIQTMPFCERMQQMLRWAWSQSLQSWRTHTYKGFEFSVYHIFFL